MDWTKAKNILIVALLLTNIILGGLYYFQQLGKDAAPETEIDATVELLARHGIYVDVEIPDKTKKMPVLFVKYDTMDEDLLENVLKKQTPQQGHVLMKEEAKELCDGILKACGWMEDSVTFDSYWRQGDTSVLVYKNVYEGIQLEESEITCEIRDGQVVSVNRLWLTPVGYGKTKQRVVQSMAALIQFMSEWVKEKDGKEEEAEEVHIEEIRLVYWLNSSEAFLDGVTEDTAVPAWKLTYNGGQVSYIQAYDQK